MRTLAGTVVFLSVYAVGCSCADSHERDAGDFDVGEEPDAGSDAGSDAPDAPPPDLSTCELAAAAGSHYGCEHWIVDLDNATVPVGSASSAPFGVSVANPGPGSAEVTIERSTAAVGGAPVVVVVERAALPPGTARTFSLGAFELDGSSAAGTNDGTHTAISAAALRVRSTAPVAVIQQNPVVGASATFSEGTSLVLPSHLLGDRYPVVAWPQTIADSTDPAHDFDSSRTDEDLRAFLTIVGTEAGTAVTVTLGRHVVRVVGGGGIAEAGPGDVRTATLGAFEVLNLETGAFGADFTGSVVSASAPVAVFVGSEAADVPVFDDVGERACCGDHLEVQLPPAERAGTRFVVARSPSRIAPLNAAREAVDLPPLPEADPLEWVRVLAVEERDVIVTTSLAPPLDRLTVPAGDFVDVGASDDFTLDADGRVFVLQTTPAGEAFDSSQTEPSGDPDLVWVPPIEAAVREASFEVPPGMLVDTLAIVAPTGATVRLDGDTLPERCTHDPLAEWTVHRCDLSSPEVSGGGLPGSYADGVQDDGFHVLTADAPFLAWSYGYARAESYGHSLGAMLRP